MVKIAWRLAGIVAVMGITACDVYQPEDDQVFAQSQTDDNATDTKLMSLIKANSLTGNALEGRDIPDISSAKAQLGMSLFFSKSLGGDRDSACVTCHHPALGGGDNLSLSVGVGALTPDLLGLGRRHSNNADHYDGGPPVPRNAPTTFNIAAWDSVMFHDGRVESFGKTPGAIGDDGQGIRTPDSVFGEIDALADLDLVTAQAKFPVTSAEEMKGFEFEDKSGREMRVYLASRIGGYGEGAGELVDSNFWLTQFRRAFNNPTATSEMLITEDTIAETISSYERSQAFSTTPWRNYIEGDSNALSDSAKEGALLFYTSVANGGAACSSCHTGDLFSDEEFHNIAMPQIGRGKGDGADGTADFGRFRETKLLKDKYAFRTPTLLNVEVTGPWSHAGAYTSLEDTVRHHLDPAQAVSSYDYAQLTQSGISNLDKMQSNTQEALDLLRTQQNAGESKLENSVLTDAQVGDIVEFLKSLTDPCVTNRECLGQWIPEAASDPNGDQLDAIDASGAFL